MVDQLVFDVASYHNLSLEAAADLLCHLTADEVEVARGDEERTARGARGR